MAGAFPKSVVYGFDSHASSIETARIRAEESGVVANCRFEQRSAKDDAEAGFDLICFMDALHDMGDPVGAARNASRALAPGGTLLVVEPAAQDTVDGNINPVSRLYCAASTGVCTPCSRSQEVGLALGAQAGPKRLSEVLRQAGFAHVRIAARTPFNLIVEARP